MAMILIPNMDATIFIDEDKCCTVSGHPWEIGNALFIEEIEIDDKTTLIRPSICKEIALFNNGNMACMLYEQFFEMHNIKANRITDVHPKEFFKGKNLWSV